MDGISSFELFNTSVVGLGILAALFNVYQAIANRVVSPRTRFTKSVLTAWLLQDLLSLVALGAFLWANIWSIVQPYQATWSALNLPITRALVTAEIVLALNSVLRMAYFFAIRGIVAEDQQGKG